MQFTLTPLTPVFAAGLVIIPRTILTLNCVFSRAYGHPDMAFSIAAP